MKSKKKYIVFISVGVFFILLISIVIGVNLKKKSRKIEKEIEKVFTVRTASVEKGTIEDYIKLSGDVITKVNVDAYADVQYGKISKIYVDIGDYVKKGQIIAKVDPSLPGTKYNESPVRAPITGYVTAKIGQLGMTVSASVPLFKVGNMRTLQVKTSVPERYVGLIRKNQNAKIKMEAFSDKEFSLKIIDISPILDPLSRTMDIWMEFRGDISGIKPGMFGTVKIYTSKKNNVILVDVDTVVSRFGENFVFIRENLVDEVKEEVSNDISDLNSKDNKKSKEKC